LSERGRGTWAELKTAWDWLAEKDADPAGQAWTAARDLSALGHLEISWGERSEWAIAPSVLTLLPAAGRALLTGARTRELYVPPDARSPIDEVGSGRLVDAVNELNLFLDPWPQSGGPTTVTIAIEGDGDAELLAGELGVPYTYAVAEQLARLLPPLRSYEKTWTPGELLRGFDAEVFDTSSCLWEPTDETGAPGLYRSRTWSKTLHAIRTATGTWFRVPPEPAVYEVLRWAERQVIEYDAHSRELIVPGTAALPLLHARAATLCSGRVPERRSRRGRPSRVTYLNVTPFVAEKITQSLNQPLTRCLTHSPSSTASSNSTSATTRRPSRSATSPSRPSGTASSGRKGRFRASRG
jgi:hypothetical protein